MKTPPIALPLPFNPVEALREIASYLRTVRMDQGRQVIEDRELAGYWQTTEWIGGLLEIANQIEKFAFESKRLRFDELRRANVARYKDYPCDDWTLTDWGCCLAGEVGELCNLLKKLKLGKPIDRVEIAKEIADVIIYADILSEKLGFDLGQVVRDKFNEVSKRVGSKVEL